MNMLAILLQAAAPAGQAQGGGATMWIMLILIFGVMWLFMIRPQRREQKRLEEFRRGLKKGDKVVTAGGIYGTVAEVRENERYLVLRVDGDVKLRVDKASVQADPTVVVKQEEKPAKEENPVKEEKHAKEEKKDEYQK